MDFGDRNHLDFADDGGDVGGEDEGEAALANELFDGVLGLVAANFGVFKSAHGLFCKEQSLYYE